MVNQYQNKFLNQCLNPYVMLTLSVVAVAASIVGHRSGTEVFALVLLHIVMSLVSVRIAHTDHRLFSTRFFYSLLALVVVSLLCDGITYFLNDHRNFRTFFLVTGAMIRFYIFGYGWMSLIKTLATKQKVTENTIITAIFAYLFIGIFYSFAYFSIWQLDPNAFHISVVRDYEFRPRSLVMYFSFMTLTTVGYGDIIPVNQWLMAVAMFEAMTGAIYLTVVVARLVSLFSSPD